MTVFLSYIFIYLSNAIIIMGQKEYYYL